jgi:hypothetical protein
MSGNSRVILVVVFVLAAILGLSRFSLEKTFQTLNKYDYSSLEVPEYGLKIVATGDKQLIKHWGIFGSTVAINNVQIWQQDGQILAEHTDISLEIPIWRLLTFTSDKASLVLHNGNYQFDRLLNHGEQLGKNSALRLGLDNIEIVGFAEGTTYIVEEGDIQLTQNGVSAELSYYDTKYEKTLSHLEFQFKPGNEGKAQFKHQVAGIETTINLKGNLSDINNHQMAGNFKLLYSSEGYGSSEISGQAGLNNGILDITDLKSSSTDIKGFSGDVRIDFLGKADSFIKLAADSFQLNKWWFGLWKSLKPEQNHDVLQQNIERFDFTLPKFISFTTEVAFTETFFGEENLGKFELQGKLHEGKYNIDNLSFGLPQGGSVKLNAIMSHNSIRPKISGKISIKHPNFGKYISLLQKKNDMDNARHKEIGQIYLQGDFTIIPRSLRFENIKSLIDQLKFKGDVITRLDGQEQLSTYATFLFDGLDAKNINLEKSVSISILFELFKADYDKTGEYFQPANWRFQMAAPHDNPRSILDLYNCKTCYFATRKSATPSLQS